MKSRNIAFLSLLACLFLARVASPINGIAVHTAWWWPLAEGNPNFWNDKIWRGKLVVVKIENNKAVKWDTIYNKNCDQGLAQYPALSFDGKKIAFFRWSTKLTKRAGGGWDYVTSSDAGPHHLSVINVDGSGLVDLIEVAKPCGSTLEITCEQGLAFCLLDWAQNGTSGDWIYYEKPTKTSEIWRINVVTKANELVKKIPDGSRPTSLTRFTMSIDAKWAAGMSRGGPQSPPTCGANDFNNAWGFPSLSPSIYESGCNISVSTMGNFVAYYAGGNHSRMMLQKWNHSNNSLEGTIGDWHSYDEHTVEDIQTWIGETLFKPGCTGGAEMIRFSVNSEKWCQRMIGSIDQGMNVIKGTNQVAVNWKDNQAINISKNPMPALDCASSPPSNNPSRCADAGDMWIDFGADKWENESGQLTDYPFTFTHTQVTSTLAMQHGALLPKIMRDNRGIFAGMGGSAFSLMLIDGHGRTIFSSGNAGAGCFVPAARLPRGVCVAVTRAAGATAQARTVIPAL